MIRTLLFISTLLIFAAQSAMASTISYLGVDTSTKAAWRSSGTAKTSAFDLNGDNVYGSDGYYVAYKSATGAGTNANGFGVDVLSQLPSYVTSVSALVSNTYWAKPTIYAAIDNPSLSGSSVDDLYATGLWQNTSATSGTYANFFTVTLSEDADFVLTVITGTHGQLQSNATGIKITSSDSTTLTQTVTASTTPEYVFFEIKGQAGDTFTIAMTGGTTEASCSGIAFESVPEPSSTAMTIVGAAGLLAFTWRKRRRR